MTAMVKQQQQQQKKPYGIANYKVLEVKELSLS